MADKEVEDHNAFNRWDSMGAALMLSVFPAVVCVLYNNQDIKGAILWLLVGLASAGGIFLLSLILSTKFLGKLVNIAGWVLTIIYGCWAYEIIVEDFEKLTSDPAAETPSAPATQD